MRIAFLIGKLKITRDLLNNNVDVVKNSILYTEKMVLNINSMCVLFLPQQQKAHERNVECKEMYTNLRKS